jgi:orotidine-5'-phosphate decarboxylase
VTGPAPFADRLIAAARRFGPLCVGVDPHPALLPHLFGRAGPDAAAAWGLALVDRCAGKVAAVKPQAGLFERWGSRGMAALERVCDAARAAGLVVILDAKRGDIGTTAEGYAEAWLGEAAACACDALTVNPWLGVETLEPFIALAERHGRGVCVLARTSNPGAADFQAKLVDEEPLYLHVARALARPSARLRGASGWSGLMLVVGATAPAEALAVRAAAPDALFLVPGYGAQGATAAEAVAGFVPGPAGREGGVVNASRAVASPSGAEDARSTADWDAAVDAAIARAQAELAAAVRAGSAS